MRFVKPYIRSKIYLKKKRIIRIYIGSLIILSFIVYFYVVKEGQKRQGKEEEMKTKLIQEWVGFTGVKNIQCLVEEGKYLWVGTDRGLVKLNKSTGEFIVFDEWNSKLPDNNVTAIAIDEQGNKWIGTNGGGLAKFDGANWTVYNTSNSGLPDNDVYVIAIDGQGNKWIGTDGGLAVYREGGIVLPVEEKEKAN